MDEWIRGLPIWAQHGVPLIAVLYLVWLWRPEIKEKATRYDFVRKWPPIQRKKPAPIEGNLQFGPITSSATVTVVKPPFCRRILYKIRRLLGLTPVPPREQKGRGRT